MDPVIIAAIITGGCTIIAAIIGCLTAKSIAKNKIKQTTKGDNNNISANIGENNG